MLIGALTAGVQAVFLNMPSQDQLAQKGGPRGPKPDFASMSEDEIEAAKEAFCGHICRKAGLSRDECDALDEADIKELAEHLKSEFESMSEEERAAAKDAVRERKSLAQKGGPRGPKPDFENMSEDEIEAAKEAFGGHICRKAGLSRDECDALDEADIKELAEHLKSEFESMSEEERAAAKDAVREKMSLAQDMKDVKRGKVCRLVGLSREECDSISDEDLKAAAQEAKAHWDSLSEEERAAAKDAVKERMSPAQDDHDVSRGRACRLARLSREECDSISDEDLRAAAEEARAHWESLSEEERAAAKARHGALAQKEGGEQKPAEGRKPRPSLEDLADEFGFDVEDLEGLSEKEVHEYLRQLKDEQFEDGEWKPTQEEVEEHLEMLADEFDFDVEELDGLSHEEVKEFLEQFFDGEDGEERAGPKGPRGPKGPKGGDDKQKPRKEGESKPAKQ